MNILAFETSFATCSVGLIYNHPEQHLILRDHFAPMQQASLLLPMINDILAEAELAFKDLDAVAYGCGPGSFTGIRIANSAAQSIGYAAGLPIIRLSSMAVLAQALHLQQFSPTLAEATATWSYQKQADLSPIAVAPCTISVALDARVGHIYWGLYDFDQAGTLVNTPVEQAQALQNLALSPPTLHALHTLAVGDGWEKYSAELSHQLGFQPPLFATADLPIARALLSLARQKWSKKEVITAGEAVPSYLR